jgi:plastocyanin
MKRLLAVLCAVAVVAAAMLAIPALGATRSVSLRDNVFSPRSLTVRKGTTVRFVWRGKNQHNVRVTSGPSRFASSVKTRGSFSRRLTRRGTYRILCSIHAPRMRMTIRVR